MADMSAGRVGLCGGGGVRHERGALERRGRLVCRRHTKTDRQGCVARHLIRCGATPLPRAARARARERGSILCSSETTHGRCAPSCHCTGFERSTLSARARALCGCNVPVHSNDGRRAAAEEEEGRRTGRRTGTCRREREGCASARHTQKARTRLSSNTCAVYTSPSICNVKIALLSS